jgi:hypothetical protein
MDIIHQFYLEQFPFLVDKMEWMIYVLDILTFLVIIKIVVDLPAFIITGGKRRI